jgi:helix-turn-helix protein
MASPFRCFTLGWRFVSLPPSQPSSGACGAVAVGKLLLRFTRLFCPSRRDARREREWVGGNGFPPPTPLVLYINPLGIPIAFWRESTMSKKRESGEKFKGIWVPREILRVPGVNPTQKLLWSSIHGLDKQGECWATNAYFEKLLNLSERQVKYSIQALKKKGLLTVEKQKRGTNQRLLQTIQPSVDEIDSGDIRVPASGDMNVPRPGTSASPDRGHECTPDNIRDRKKKSLQGGDCCLSSSSHGNKAHKILQLLASAIEARTGTAPTEAKVTSWQKPITALITTDGVTPNRVMGALRWYKRHCQDQYVPLIRTGHELRLKFQNLEDAIQRQRNGKAKVTTPATTTKPTSKFATRFLGENRFPSEFEADAGFVRACEDWHTRVRAWAKQHPGTSAADWIEAELPDAGSFGEAYGPHVTTTIAGWPDYNHSNTKAFWPPQGKLFREWLERWCKDHNIQPEWDREHAACN